MFARSSLVLQAALLAATSTYAADVSFSYDPDSAVGPANWGSIEGSDCAGSAQSGINVETKDTCDEDQVDYLFAPGDCTVQNLIFSINDHGVKASFPALTDEICTPPRMTIPNIPNGEFEALQFHIHMGSEHAIDNEFFGADLHIVHQQVNGSRYAVLGLFLDPAVNGTEGNAAFADLITGWEAVAADNQAACTATTSRNLDTRQRKTQEATPFNVYDMVPDGFSTYYYQGSLTTPPCSEVVNWNVVDKPVYLSSADFSAMSSLILDFVGQNCTQKTVAFDNVTARPLQELNGRTVVHKCMGDGSGNKVVTDEATAPAPPTAASSSGSGSAPSTTPASSSAAAASVAATFAAFFTAAFWM